MTSTVQKQKNRRTKQQIAKDEKASIAKKKRIDKMTGNQKRKHKSCNAATRLKAIQRYVKHIFQIHKKDRFHREINI